MVAYPTLHQTKTELTALFKKQFADKLKEQMDLYSHIDLLWILSAVNDHKGYLLTNIGHVVPENYIDVEMEIEDDKPIHVGLIFSKKIN